VEACSNEKVKFGKALANKAIKLDFTVRFHGNENISVL